MLVRYIFSESTRAAVRSASGRVSQSRTCCSRSAFHEASSRQSKASYSERRVFSTNSASSTTSTSDSPIRISHVLGALVVIGVGATSWGLYEFYMTLTMWPNEVRGDLRAGLRAKQRGDLKLSQRHLSRAWETIQNMPSELLSPDPYLKYSGVAIVLAEVLEADKQLEEAYDVLRKAAIYFIEDGKPTPPTPPISSSASSEPSTSASSSRSAPSPRRVSLSTLLDSWRYNNADGKLNTRPRMRAVALALKLGDMAETLSKPEEEERWLEFSVAEVLRIIRDEYNLVHDSRRGFVPVGNTDASAKSKDGDTSGKNSGTEGDAHDTSVRDILSPDTEDAELGLPTWVSLTKTELAAPMERLGAYYARQGRAVNAILLYRVASSLLVHPKSKSPSSNPLSRSSAPSVTELCQALQIENAHMALLMDLRRARPEDAAVQRDLPRVLTRAIQIYDEAVRKHGQGQSRDDGVAADSEIALCDQAYPAVLYNAGVYYEEEGQLEQALRSYSLAYMALRTHGSREMMQDALENARRLQRIVDKNAKHAASRPTTQNDPPPPTN